MKKREAILIGFISIVLLTFGSVAQAAPGPAISVSPASIEVSHGETFTIEITVDPKGNEVYGAQYGLYFNNNLLEALTQSQGTFLSQDGAETNVFVNETNNSIGRIVYIEARRKTISGVTNPGTLASITFKVIGTSGTTDLKLSNVKLTDPNVKSIGTKINGGKCNIGKVTGKPAVADITVEEAYQMLEVEEGPEGIILEEFIILDVRTEEEYNAEHIRNAKHIPLSELENRIDELDKSKKIIIYSMSGIKSREAGEILVKHGFELVYNMLGGIDAWRINYPEYLVKAMPTPPFPALSPSPSPTTAVSPISPTPEGKWGLPGFEAGFAIIGLSAISYFMLRRRRADKK